MVSQIVLSQWGTKIPAKEQACRINLLMKHYNLFSLLILIGFLSTGKNAFAQQGFAIRQSMLIFPLQSEHVHASSVVRLPNGDYLTAWFQGTGERKADDARIMGARLQKGDTAWSVPFGMADTHGLPDCNPVLFLNNQGKLFLVWIAVQANQWEASILRYRTTTDYRTPGPPKWTWQDDILLKPDTAFSRSVAAGFGKLPDSAGWGAYALPYERLIGKAAADPVKRSFGWMTRTPALILPSGRMLLPLYSDGFNLSIIAISDDAGTTWRPSLPIVGKGNVQPALLLKKDGTLVALMRDNGDAPSRMQSATSPDQGETWSVARKTTFPETASVAAMVLKDGRWVLIANGQDNGRYQLGLYVSSDEGKTWNQALVLEKAAMGKGSFSYPSIVQDPSGMLHITYSYVPASGTESIKYVVVTPQAAR